MSRGDLLRTYEIGYNRPFDPSPAYVLYVEPIPPRISIEKRISRFARKRLSVGARVSFIRSILADRVRYATCSSARNKRNESRLVHNERDRERTVL